MNCFILFSFLLIITSQTNIIGFPLVNIAKHFQLFSVKFLTTKSCPKRIYSKVLTDKIATFFSEIPLENWLEIDLEMDNGNYQVVKNFGFIKKDRKQSLGFFIFSNEQLKPNAYETTKDFSNANEKILNQIKASNESVKLTTHSSTKCIEENGYKSAKFFFTTNLGTTKTICCCHHFLGKNCFVQILHDVTIDEEVDENAALEILENYTKNNICVQIATS